MRQNISVHGHRGSRGTHPENTIPGFTEAVEAGADRIELDVVLSRDDVPVVFHDAFITDRVCTRPDKTKVIASLPVRQLLASEITQYDCGSIPQEKFPHQRMVPNTRIPTLRSVCEWVVGRKESFGLNIEIKVPTRGSSVSYEPKRITDRVLDILIGFDLMERAHLLSFNFGVHDYAKGVAKNLPRYYLFSSEENFCELIQAEGGQIASPKFTLLSTEKIEWCIKNGIELVPYTVNDEADWKWFIDAGIKAIVTDYPRKLLRYLNQRSETKSEPLP